MRGSPAADVDRPTRFADPARASTWTAAMSGGSAFSDEVRGWPGRYVIPFRAVAMRSLGCAGLVGLVVVISSRYQIHALRVLTADAVVLLLRTMGWGVEAASPYICVSGVWYDVGWRCTALDVLFPCVALEVLAVRRRFCWACVWLIVLATLVNIGRIAACVALHTAGASWLVCHDIPDAVMRLLICLLFVTRAVQGLYSAAQASWASPGSPSPALGPGGVSSSAVP